jgi:hypothetical protein
MKYLDRITFDPEQCGGRPCVRGMRIRVKDVLEMLAAGVGEPEILADFPYLAGGYSRFPRVCGHGDGSCHLESCLAECVSSSMLNFRRGSRRL